MAVAAQQAPRGGFLSLRWSNWQLALVAALIIIPLSVWLLPQDAAFWISLAAAALVAFAAVAMAFERRHHGALLVAPAVALLFLMNIFPLLWSLGLSFFRFKATGRAAPAWIGFDNFANVLTSEDVWDRLGTTGLIMILTVGCQLVVGFALAMLFEKQFRGRRVLLMLVLTPMMLSYVAVGAFFRYYYEPTFGLLSQFVRMFTGEPYILLDSVWGARAGLVFADAWMWSPFVMLLALAGLSAIPQHLYEAAAIDRASWWYTFRRITLPLVAPLLLIALIFRTMEAFKTFDLPFVMSAQSVETVAIALYQMAFQGWDTGRASALAYIVLIVVLCITNIYVKYLNKIKER